jgi:hypothetical protein
MTATSNIDPQAWIDYRDELTRYYVESGVGQAEASQQADRAMLRELSEHNNGHRNGGVAGSFLIEETLLAHWKVYSLDATTGRRCWRGTFRERRDAVCFVKAAQAD